MFASPHEPTGLNATAPAFCAQAVCRLFQLRGSAAALDTAISALLFRSRATQAFHLTLSRSGSGCRWFARVLLECCAIRLPRNGFSNSAQSFLFQALLEAFSVQAFDPKALFTPSFGRLAAFLALQLLLLAFRFPSSFPRFQSASAS